MPVMESQMLMPLLNMVPEGYFAVRLDDTNEAFRFFRLSRADTKRYKNTTRIQSIHSDELYMRFTYWHNADVTWRDPYCNFDLDTYLLLIVTDFQGAMMRYAQEINQCARCNKRLTDERSRWYGIGPDCEKVIPWYIERVDESERGPYVEGVSNRDS